MEQSTNIRSMMARNTISVPDYQRAYSWDTEVGSKTPPKQVNMFIDDLEEYNNSQTASKYYFGHFLFEKIEDEKFGVIDGQQRLTTIVIFLTVLFRRLKFIRELTEGEEEIYEDVIKRRSKYRFSTVDYDNLAFRDYVIDGNPTGNDNFETESQKRIVRARDYFTDRLGDRDESYLTKMLSTLSESQCTTHIVTNESEAIQMFIFQNNRGKRPSSLEIIKAQFMFNVHLYADGDEKENLINEIKDRFGKIYRSISRIEYKIDEDDVLTYTLRVHSNSLTESDAVSRVNRFLSEEDPINFVKRFTKQIHESFAYLEQFFCEDEEKYLDVHSITSLGGIGIALPFIIKAYAAGLQKTKLCALCSSLESLLVRHRLIGTRADINTRLNDVFREFSKEKTCIRPIIERIDYMKQADSWWWAHWNNEALKTAIQGHIHHPTARFLLWKYEIHLASLGRERGYLPSRFDDIIDPELEHIAPITENPCEGYDYYDEEFRNQYIDCLGNYLLLSKSHNCSIGNRPFEEKRASFTHSYQQREIQEMTISKSVWTKRHIMERKEKIVIFVTDKF